MIAGVVLALALIAGAAVHANERPFVLADTAVREEDDERVFELVAGVERAGRAHAVFTELEYSFVPGLSIELAWERRLARDDEGQRETELQAGVRHVWRDPARHAVGAAVTLEVEASRETSSSERGRWRVENTTLSLPLSRQWAMQHGYAWAHLSVGAQHRREHGVRPLLAVAGQAFATRSLELFGEWGAVRERQSLAQAGVRWWIRRERIALDIAAGRCRDEGERVRTFALQLSLMDLSP